MFDLALYADAVTHHVESSGRYVQTEVARQYRGAEVFEVRSYVLVRPSPPAGALRPWLAAVTAWWRGTAIHERWRAWRELRTTGAPSGDALVARLHQILGPARYRRTQERKAATLLDWKVGR